jgi:hypothetical protein
VVKGQGKQDYETYTTPKLKRRREEKKSRKAGKN